MTGNRGFVQSIIRRGWDVYQVTLGIFPEAGTEAGSERPGEAPDRDPKDKLFVYRADIAIEDNRTILFPDRELGKCFDAFYGVAEAAGEGLETQKYVGKIAAEMCRELSDRLLDSRIAAAV